MFECMLLTKTLTYPPKGQKATTLEIIAEFFYEEGVGLTREQISTTALVHFYDRS
jgi:hypothetical protein